MSSLMRLLHLGDPNSVAFNYLCVYSLFSAFEDHRALILGFTGIMCATVLAVWPLTFQCRRRRARRRARREILTREGLRPVKDIPHPPPLSSSEVDPLLGYRNATSYGAQD